MKKTLKNTLTSITVATLLLSATAFQTVTPPIKYHPITASAVDINEYNQVTYSDKYGDWMFYLTTAKTATNVEVTLGRFTPKADIKTVTVPSKITAKGKDFNNKEFKVTATVTGIYTNAMSKLQSLKSITIPNTIKSIGASAFEGCTFLSTITLPNSVKSIGNTAFKNCVSLTNITIPESVTNIGSQTFENCSSLYNINANISVLEKSYLPFKGCDELEKINKEDIIINNQVNSKIQKIFSNYNYGDSAIIDSVMPDIIKFIAVDQTKNCKTEIEKAKALHDWICRKVYYDKNFIGESDNHNDYSVFLNDNTVCEGYARAYTLLLQAIDIEAYYVCGSDADKHAWNIVKIGDSYYHVDCCWDDDTTDRTGKVFDYDNFFVSDSYIRSIGSHSETNISKSAEIFKKYNGKKTAICNSTIGDANGDGIRSNEDYKLLESYIRKTKELTDTQIKALDVNFDGKTDLTDLTYYTLMYL